MATPLISDFILYTTTPLTDTDYAFNWAEVVKYVSDGTFDFTVNSLTTTNNVTVGGDLAVTGGITVGDGNISTAAIADGAITPAKMTRNIASTLVTSDFSTQSTSFVTRTDATVTITGVRASGSVRLSVRNVFWLLGVDNTAGVIQRINVDSGAQYRAVGKSTLNATKTIIAAAFGGFLGGDMLFTGLSAGSHTFTLEVKVLLTGHTFSQTCSTNPEDFVVELIAEEV